MTIGCNIWMICLKLKRIFYGLSRMLHLSEFVWILRSSVLVVFNNFLLIDADRSKICSDQKRFFNAWSLYPLSFSRTLPLNQTLPSLHRQSFEFMPILPLSKVSRGKNLSDDKFFTQNFPTNLWIQNNTIMEDKKCLTWARSTPFLNTVFNPETEICVLRFL